MNSLTIFVFLFVAGFSALPWIVYELRELAIRRRIRARLARLNDWLNAPVVGE